MSFVLKTSRVYYSKRRDKTGSFSEQTLLNREIYLMVALESLQLIIPVKKSIYKYWHAESGTSHAYSIGP